MHTMLMPFSLAAMRTALAFIHHPKRKYRTLAICDKLSRGNLPHSTHPFPSLQYGLVEFSLKDSRSASCSALNRLT